MKSKKPKVAHEILGKPLIGWVIDAAQSAGINRIITVVGHKREQVIPLVEKTTDIVVQPNRRGTADAVAVCEPSLADYTGSLLVLSGDCPLISAQTLSLLIQQREATNAACAVLTMELDNPFSYGRIIRDETGNVCTIIEQKDATEEQALVRECNAGFYCFDAQALFQALKHVSNNNAQGEYYLTDVIEVFVQAGKRVEAVLTDTPHECLGINSRAQLAQAHKVAQRQINAKHMNNGVTMIDPNQVWIGPNVTIEQDVTLLPQVFLMGTTSIGEDSVIGPHTRLTDTTVGKQCRVDETIAVEATLDTHVTCGPRAYLRPGAHLCDGAKAGTHVEIKKSIVGKNSRVPHLSYIGDTVIGEGVNVGAGSITCNYDGKHKHATTIGDGAFIGSDTMMVAPVHIGANATIGAGSCITKDVPADALGLTRPTQVVIAGWTTKQRKKQAEEDNSQGS